MLKTNLFVAFFSLFSIYTQLNAQAFGLKIQPGFSNQINGSGVRTNNFNNAFSAGLFVEDRFNDHHAVGIELSGLQIKSKGSTLVTSTIFNPTGTFVTLTYAGTVENTIQYMVVNGYYRYLRGRWGYKSGMQLMIPLMETTKTTFSKDAPFEGSTNTDIGMSYFKVGLTGGLECAINKRFRAGVDYYREIGHFARSNSPLLFRTQIFSVGVKYSFIRSRYKFS